MNRVLLFAVAAFLAVVGLALVGADVNTAQAGHCCGCHHSHHCHGCYGCHGGGYEAGGAPAGGGGVAPPPPVNGGGEPPAPEANRDFQRRPFGYRQVSFRR